MSLKFIIIYSILLIVSNIITYFVSFRRGVFAYKSAIESVSNKMKQQGYSFKVYDTDGIELDKKTGVTVTQDEVIVNK